MGLIKTLIGFIIIITLSYFGIMNAEIVSVTWSPFHDPLTMPLYAACLVLMAIGFLIGGMAVWMNGGKTRKEKRQAKKHVKELEKKLEKIECATQAEASSDLFPSLPSK